MVIFHSYVKLPEGKVKYQPWWVHNDFPSRCSQPLFFGEFAENRGGLARNPMLNDINHGKILLYMYNQHVYINYITYYYKLYNLQKLGDVIYHDVSPTAICVTIECFPHVCRNITPNFFPSTVRPSSAIVSMFAALWPKLCSPGRKLGKSQGTKNPNCKKHKTRSIRPMSNYIYIYIYLYVISPPARWGLLDFIRALFLRVLVLLLVLLLLLD